MRSIVRRPALALAVGVLVACGDSGTGADDTAHVRVQNTSTLTANEVYLRPCSFLADTVWGSYRLRFGRTISPGGALRFEIAPGCWDIRVEFTTNVRAIRFAADVAEGERFTFTINDR